MPPPLETERLILRVPRLADAEPLFRWFGDAEVMRWVASEPHADVARTRVGIERGLACLERLGSCLWTVVDRASGEIVGDCGLKPLADRAEIEVAYRLGKPWWGRGYATEAARAAVEHGFGELGLERIVAVALPENTASRRVMEKLGMSFVGTDHVYGLDVVRYELERPRT